MPKRTPGTDNRVLRVCRLLNGRRVRYLIAGGVAGSLHGSTVAATVTFDDAYPRRVVRRIAAVRVPYLSLDDFVRSKRTGRPQDVADIQRVRGTKRR